MKMSFAKFILPAVTTCLLPFSGMSATTGDALYQIRRAEEMTDKYPDAEIRIPAHIDGNKGKYLSPYTSDEYFTGWIKSVLEETRDWQVPDLYCREREASKTHGITTSDVTGVQSRTREGGSIEGLRKCHRFEAGQAAGGWDNIREQSDMSFARVEDFAVYLHTTYGRTVGYPQVLAIVMSIYPELEKRYAGAVMRAHVSAVRETQYVAE